MTTGRRYDQCDSTCTADCGHCKGNGVPAACVAQANGACHRTLPHEPHGSCPGVLLGGAGGCDHGNRVCIYDDVPDTEQAVMFAPDGWDERTQSPVDEQAESLRDADPPDEPCEPPVCHSPVISLFEHTVGHGECVPGPAKPTAPTDLNRLAVRRAQFEAALADAAEWGFKVAMTGRYDQCPRPVIEWDADGEATIMGPGPF